MKPALVAVMGPTASGKTEFAEALADATGFVLVNADAFQVYRGLDIGTGKSARKSEYLLLDLVEPSFQFGAGEWISCAEGSLRALWNLGRGAIVVGGSHYYIRALFENFDQMHGPPDPELRRQLDERSLDQLVAELKESAPEVAARIDLQNRVRVQRALERLGSPVMSFELPPFPKLKLGLDVDPEELRDRIERRVHRMVEQGWVEEVKTLAGRGVTREDPGMRAHGYRALWDVAFNGKDLSDAIDGIVLEVAQYAKRQRTWLRKEPNLAKMPRQDGGNALATALEMLGDL